MAIVQALFVDASEKWEARIAVTSTTKTYMKGAAFHSVATAVSTSVTNLKWEDAIAHQQHQIPCGAMRGLMTWMQGHIPHQSTSVQAIVMMALVLMVSMACVHMRVAVFHKQTLDAWSITNHTQRPWQLSGHFLMIFGWNKQTQLHISTI